MTDMQERVNRLLSISDSTRSSMMKSRREYIQRTEVSLQQERLQLAAIKCAQLLSDFSLKMGQRVQLGEIVYQLTEVSGDGKPVGKRVRADGSLESSSRYIFFRHRLEQIIVV
ncbi:hypothetical protein [Spirosoma oryzicola]|uniref:hypothetical protein n=1 Tax=Spirosoma oryzicola TaxID=2898794 RepID=UPI001E64FF62|nr:hypothetical protein [Spirosoma oryzicola]UHG91786.1 hypothetical protein LQ777_02545 [Spirosoma oryzicola]